jgi:cytochrome oxidase Cu insertion factor (SCO1/SenC/PrrC family)
VREKSVLLAICSVLFISCAAPGSPPSGQPATAPDFSVETFEGKGFELSAHKGTPVVINFWESW